MKPKVEPKGFVEKCIAFAREVNIMSNNSSTYIRMHRDRGNAEQEKRLTNKERTRGQGSKNHRIRSPLKFTGTLCEKVILAINVDHAILQYALPLIFNPGNLVVGAKDDVTYTWTLIWVLLTFRVRVIQIAVNRLVVGASSRALRRLR